MNLHTIQLSVIDFHSAGEENYSFPHSAGEDNYSFPHSVEMNEKYIGLPVALSRKERNYTHYKENSKVNMGHSQKPHI